MIVPVPVPAPALVLVIAEHDHHSLRAGTLNTVGAASLLGGEIHVLVAGSACAAAAGQAARLTGVGRVLLADAIHYAGQTAENLAALIHAHAAPYSHILAPAGTCGKNALPRLAALLDVAQISEISAVVAPDTFVRPVYAGNALATVTSHDAVKVVTVRTTAFDAAGMRPDGDAGAPVAALAPGPDLGLARVTGRSISVSERPELGVAKIIVAGGRGLGGAEQYQAMLAPLADKLGAALGASRAAVDAGYVPNDYQIGQTGKIVAPQLYVAVGISGAIQHLAGMKDSTVIVAINNDADAPIFQVADYGLVADLFAALPELSVAL